MGLIEGFVNSGEGEMFPPLNNVDVDISSFYVHVSSKNISFLYAKISSEMKK